MELKPEVKDALIEIANGRSIMYLKNACAEINGVLIHCRYASGSGEGDKNKYPFNINPNTLTAQYELWVCGSSDWYYLIPINIIKDIYNDPDTYVNKYQGQESIKTVNITVSEDLIKFGRNDKWIQISEYWNKDI